MGDDAANKDLFAFVDNLNEEGTDVCVDVEHALNNWTQRVLDAESCLSKSKTFHQQIEDAIRRLQLDGLLASHDITELQYIAELWVKLMNAVSSYSIGCKFVKRDIITYLLELCILKQIDSNLFIESCLKL